MACGTRLIFSISAEQVIRLGSALGHIPGFDNDPEKGDDTPCEDIALQIMGDIKDTINDVVNETQDTINDVVNETQEKLNDVVDETQEKLSDVVNETQMTFNDVVNETQGKLNVVVDETQETFNEVLQSICDRTDLKSDGVISSDTILKSDQAKAESL